MNTNKQLKYIKLLGPIAILAIPVYLIVRVLLIETPDPMYHQKATYVGKENCKECHLGEYDDWLKSHHNKAMDYANDSTVLGNFDNATLESRGFTHRLYKEDGKFMVYTDGAEGKMEAFEIKYVFGYTPLQQYLIEFDGGRLQTLSITWNTIDSVWYHMADYIYQDEKVDHNNWLHWTNQAQNWNGMCAECHSTNLKKGYDHLTDTYNTTWSEINVSCEACHGPGSEHVEWANLPEYSQQSFNNFGLVIKTSGIDNVEYVDNCVRCHSRKVSLGDFDHFASSIYDHSVPGLPGEPDWFIDGQIKEEDYVYASFLQSRMYMKEIQCNDCHNVHSGERLFEGNALCLQCHIGDIYDTHDHHRHKSAGMSGDAVISESGVKFEVGSGTECINCHMPGRFYMGVDYRHDHSFRIPRPDLTIANNTPNACNQCHVDETPQWSDRYITQWFGTRRRYHPSQGFVAAQQGKPYAIDELKQILKDDLYPTSIRSLSLEHLGTNFPASADSLVDNYLSHLSPSIRLSALRTIQQYNPTNMNRLLSALTDETKAVRTEAAQRLLQIDENEIPNKYKESFNKAVEEYKQVLFFNADFPLGKINLANFYFNQNKFSEAERFFLAALKQDSELRFIKLNLAHLYNRTGKNEKAESYFKEYLSDEPEDAEALFSLALLLSEMKKYDESLAAMLKANKLSPTRPRINYNIAMMYDFMEKKDLAEYHLKKEIEVVDNLNSREALLRFYLDNNMGPKALSAGKNILKDYPNNAQVKEVVEALQQQLR